MLSGGQRQRVGIARALYGRPSLLVLDEPDASLDEAGEAALLTALKRLREAGQTAIVLITHRTGLIEVSDKLLVLKEGQVLLQGPRDGVLQELRRLSARVPARLEAAPAR